MTNQLGIYLVTQDETTDYDTYDSFICVAENEEKASNMLPASYITWEDAWDYWATSPDNVSVTYLGLVTDTSTHKEPGVILASFNAG